MTHRHLFILSCLLSLILLPARGSDHAHFLHYDTSDGLSNNTIGTLAEDKYGFIWMGTKNGTCRFDGKSFMSVGPKEIITAMCTDTDGMILISTVSGLYKINEDNSTVKEICAPDGSSIITSFSMVCDAGSRIWMTQRGELLMIDRDNDVCRHFPPEEFFSPQRVGVDEQGIPYFTATDGCLYRYDSLSGSFDRMPVLCREELEAGKSLYYMAKAGDACFILSTTSNDIFKYNVRTRQRTVLFRGNQDGRDAQVMRLLGESDGSCMAATDKGVYVFDSMGNHHLLTNDPTDEYSLSNDNIRSLLRDSKGRIWLGTYYSGVNLWERSGFRFYKSSSEDDSFRGSTVRAIAQDNSGAIWFGTEDGFLNVQEPDGTIRNFSTDSRIPESNFHSMLMEGDRMYVATWDNGIFVIDSRNSALLERMQIEKGHPVYLGSTDNGNILLGSSEGLYTYDRDNFRFNLVPGTDVYFVHTLCQCSPSTVLVGTYGRGLMTYNMQDGELGGVSWDVPQDNEPFYITSMFMDKDNRIWMASEDSGLYRLQYDADAGMFRTVHFTDADGLPSNIIGAITQSRDSRIWVSTDKGVVYIAADDRLTVLMDRDTPIGNSFRYSSILHADDDRIIMGSTLGAMSFYPSDFVNEQDCRIFITDILAGGQNGVQSVNMDGTSTFLNDSFSMPFRECSYLTFKFATPFADTFKKVRYRYVLSRGNNIIESVTEDNYFTVAGLSPGKYRFTVSVDGLSGPESSRSINLRIVPPFWLSAFAKCLYVMAVLSVFLIAYYQDCKKKKSEREQMLKAIEGEKQKEIYNAKVDFFTSIAHDIRTPLSLIKMPVDKIIKNREYTEAAAGDMKLIKANTERLLDLTNQLMDFRKVELDHLHLSFVREDVCAIVRKCCGCFTNAASLRGLSFTVDVPEEKIMIMCALSSLEKIISNMLSNAFKYCESSVSLNLVLDGSGENVTISVRSDGQKILPENRERIFEPFFQEKNRKISVNGSKGSGLGLPFSRSLARMHNGELGISEEDGPDNVFVLSIPVNQESTVEMQGVQPDESLPDMNCDIVKERQNILIAEDSNELSSYLKRELSGNYNVIVVPNGLEAVEELKKTRLDLVVSDIMMPGMDGCALCNHIKTNLEYSHIPVILLTAGVGMENHIESLRVGADGYLEKPFSIELLQANITNIFKNRELGYKQYASSPLSRFSGLKANNIDEKFMERLDSEIMGRISDSEFSVDELGSSLGMSKSSLFRKVKANTNLNINEYIRLVRLKRSAELLSEGKYRINEVAYLVGFTSPSYFASKFQQQFKLSPSEFLRQLKG